MDETSTGKIWTHWWGRISGRWRELFQFCQSVAENPHLSNARSMLMITRAGPALHRSDTPECDIPSEHSSGTPFRATRVGNRPGVLNPNWLIRSSSGAAGTVGDRLLPCEEHGITDVAVVEKSYIGSGNVGRNTLPRHSLQLSASAEHRILRVVAEAVGSSRTCLSASVPRRGVPKPLSHSDAQRDAFAHRSSAMRLNGVDAELLDRETGARAVPLLDFDNARFPIKRRLLQRRGGTVRHDAVAWGFARGADQPGVDIIQNCESPASASKREKVVGIRNDARLYQSQAGGRRRCR